ncbi:hypothetical protein KCU77_g3731, partial [Aureobasidium melanogenum]
TAAELLDRTVCLHGWVAWDHASATHGADGRSTLSSVTYRCDRLEMSSEITPTNSEDYTVAWIAALPHERAAGEMMLDHEYVQPKSFTKNVNDPNRYSWAGGHGKTVQVLLGKGVDINMQGGDYNSVLQAASVREHDKIVQMLLVRGADVVAEGG